MSLGQKQTSSKTPLLHPSTIHGVQCDQIVVLKGHYAKGIPGKTRRIRYFDSKTTNVVFLTNNFLLPAITIADLYRCRWQIELFFKWIKQHLRIKAFYGPECSKTQIWIAISVMFSSL